MTNKLSEPFLQQATEVLRAIGHPVRLQVLELLYQQEALSVTEIHQSLEVPQPVISNHLRILKDRGVISSVRKGQNSFYSLNNRVFFEIIMTIKPALAK